MNISTSIRIHAFVAVLLLAPLKTFAQSFDYLDKVVTNIGGLITVLVPVLLALALAVFLWGLVVFIFQADSDQARASGRSRMIWGIIILFVAVSVWGIVQLLYTLTGVEKDPDTRAPDTGFIGDIGTPSGGGTPPPMGGGGMPLPPLP